MLKPQKWKDRNQGRIRNKRKTIWSMKTKLGETQGHTSNALRETQKFLNRTISKDNTNWRGSHKYWT